VCFEPTRCANSASNRSTNPPTGGLLGAVDASPHRSLFLDARLGQLDHLGDRANDGAIDAVVGSEWWNSYVGDQRVVRSLALFADCAGVNRETGSFFDRHEVTGDVGVGDRDRASLSSLCVERLQHRTARTQPVAEPDRDELCVGGLVGVRGQSLGGALGPSEHIGRVRCLVRADIDETIHFGMMRGEVDRPPAGVANVPKMAAGRSRCRSTRRRR
jgi:hypothetical protein